MDTSGPLALVKELRHEIDELVTSVERRENTPQVALRLLDRIEAGAQPVVAGAKSYAEMMTTVARSIEEAFRDARAEIQGMEAACSP